MTPREAKEFLIAQIVAEANRQGEPLDDVERRMLYYTESAWMPEDFLTVQEDFQQSGHDDTEYENHIARLTRDLKRSPTFDRAAWKSAVSALKREDHYLLVLINLEVAQPATASFSLLKVFLVSVAVGAFVLVALFLYTSLR